MQADMLEGRWWLVTSILSVFAVFRLSEACAQQAPPIQSGLTEVRSLSKLPEALATTLGWHGNDKDTIADLEHDRTANSPLQVNRWFLVGGFTSDQAMIAEEERTARSNEYHIKRYTVGSGAWALSDEWIIGARPHTLLELSQLLESLQSKTLTEQWRKRIRERERNSSMTRSDPRRWHDRLPLREVDINDIEISEIEGVLHQLVPGAIVNISGVAKGCPCENGPGCTAQVWLLLYLPSRTHSMELSKIGGKWAIGPVQQWYIDLDQLKSKTWSNKSSYSAARSEMEERYPTCLAEATTAFQN